ncbi:MAG TPA: hypothetical protein VJ851_00420 [Jatrophihabitans sp.]|nr:hypothetical protein [Jatrophihabitans sp.]
MSVLGEREHLRDFAPLAERALSVDGDALIRFRSGERRVGGFVRLPFEVLAGRTIEAAGVAGSFDVTVSAKQFLVWLDGDGGEPTRADARWLSALPPRDGWRRIDIVPDTAIREVIRSGALLAQAADTRPGQQALLDSIVLTARAESGPPVEVPLSVLSALTRMGFLPRGGEAAVDTARGWIRLAAAYGSTYVSDGKPLGLLSL